jgi:hypothetical protein
MNLNYFMDNVMQNGEGGSGAANVSNLLRSQNSFENNFSPQRDPHSILLNKQVK